MKTHNKLKKKKEYEDLVSEIFINFNSVQRAQGVGMFETQYAELNNIKYMLVKLMTYMVISKKISRERMLEIVNPYNDLNMD